MVKQWELQAHWDRCAGAEATMNDLRQRAEAAEARVKELEAQIGRMTTWANPKPEAKP